MTNKELEKRIVELEKQVAKLSEPIVCNACPYWRDLNEMDWGEIVEDAKYGREFGIDEYKEFELYSGEICKAHILSTYPEQGKVAMFFTIDGKFEMNDTATNEGGWGGSKMYNTYVPRYEKMLPEDLKKHIEKMDCQGVESLIWLMSYSEVCNDDDKFGYFKKGGKISGEDEYVDEYEDKFWWLRSPYTNSSYCFWGVDSNGHILNSSANYSYGVCFAFVLS